MARETLVCNPCGGAILKACADDRFRCRLSVFGGPIAECCEGATTKWRLILNRTPPALDCYPGIGSSYVIVASTDVDLTGPFCEDGGDPVPVCVWRKGPIPVGDVSEFCAGDDLYIGLNTGGTCGAFGSSGWQLCISPHPSCAGSTGVAYCSTQIPSGCCLSPMDFSKVFQSADFEGGWPETLTLYPVD